MTLKNKKHTKQLNTALMLGYGHCKSKKLHFNRKTIQLTIKIDNNVD